MSVKERWTALEKVYTVSADESVSGANYFESHKVNALQLLHRVLDCFRIASLAIQSAKFPPNAHAGAECLVHDIIKSTPPFLMTVNLEQDQLAVVNEANEEGVVF